MILMLLVTVLGLTLGSPTAAQSAIDGEPGPNDMAEVRFEALPDGLLIEDGENGIRIHAYRVELGVLLEHLHRRSGIAFDVRPGLGQQTLDAKIEVATWSAVVEELLSGFNTVIQRTEGAQSSIARVWVLGREDTKPAPPPQPESSQPEPPARVERTPWNPGPEDGIDPRTEDAPPGVVSTVQPGDGPPIQREGVTDHQQPPPLDSMPFRPGPPGEE